MSEAARDREMAIARKIVALLSDDALRAMDDVFELMPRDARIAVFEDSRIPGRWICSVSAPWDDFVYADALTPDAAVYALRSAYLGRLSVES